MLMDKILIYTVGNGYVVSNNFGNVAHISEGGNIEWYQDDNTLTKKDRDKIRGFSHTIKLNFQKNFEAHDEGWQYYHMLDNFNMDKVRYFLLTFKTFDERLLAMRSYFYEII